MIASYHCGINLCVSRIQLTILSFLLQLFILYLVVKLNLVDSLVFAENFFTNLVENCFTGMTNFLTGLVYYTQWRAGG